MKKFVIILSILISSIQLNGNIPFKYILDDEQLLVNIESGLDHIYNFEFDQAKNTLDTLKLVRPEHPVTTFFEALIIYWQNFPLTMETPESDQFVLLMKNTYELTEEVIDDHEMDVEAVFFDLISRASMLMHYSDNGYYKKVLKLAPSAYKSAMKSFDLSKKFNEFYFVTGLYNYYIEAYPEKKPVYRPITMWFRDGDKKLGLEQLAYAKNNTKFIKIEATLFLASIYFEFELNGHMAVQTIQDIRDEYPKNPYYESNLIEYLIGNKQYAKAASYLKSHIVKHRENDFFVMRAIIFSALIQEKHVKNNESAKKKYKLGIQLAEKYSPFSDEHIGASYYGLSRIALSEGNKDLSQDYIKKAKNYSKLDLFTD